MNFPETVKLSLEKFDKSNMDPPDIDELIGTLDACFESAGTNVQIQEVWLATVTGVLFYLEKQRLKHTDFTALRELAQALSNSASGEREIRLNYPWSGSREHKAHSVLDPDKRARSIVTLENAKEVVWRILSAEQLESLIPLSRSTIWRMERRGAFPRCFTIAPGRVGWDEKAVQSWMKSRATRNVSLIQSRSIVEPKNNSAGF